MGSANRIVVVLVDGLGTAALRARAGHARTLSAATGQTIDTVFPTTTAAALASFATGAMPGEHGLVGYSVLDAAHDRVVNQLSGWDDELDPATWQRLPTVFERARAQGFSAVAVGPERFQSSGFTQAVLRGAEYRVAASISDRFAVAARWLGEPGPPGLLYLYIPELDMVAHALGWESSEWTALLEEVDSEVRRLSGLLRATDGMLLSADHGIVDIPVTAHLLIDSAPELVESVRFVAGEPRCLQLHFEPDLNTDDRDALVARWRDAESGRAWIATRDEAIAAGWFGAVAPEVLPRIGDLLVAARKNVAYYDGRAATKHSLAMIGQHGSWSPAELQVPLLRFGAFA
ncbi:MAG TPA: alkaline phosphatase family protein [Galbitalea sp.]|nr:alkaline phosphatase family protein [Galbitalea sp.]